MFFAPAFDLFVGENKSVFPCAFGGAYVNPFMLVWFYVVFAG
jgi:hypothetical protein